MWPFSLPCNFWSLMQLKEQVNVIEFSVYVKTFDLGWPLEVKSGSHNFQMVVPHQLSIVWSNLWHETHKSYIPSVISSHLTMGDIEKSNQCHCVSNGQRSINHVCCELSWFEMHMCWKSYGLSVYLMTLHLISHELVTWCPDMTASGPRKWFRIMFELTPTLTNLDLCLFTKMQVVCNMSRKTNKIQHDAFKLMHKIPMMVRGMPVPHQTFKSRCLAVCCNKQMYYY